MIKRKIKMLIMLLPMIFLAINVLPSPGVVEQADPIKIGVFVPETAGLTVYAPWTKQGFELGMT
ncbi:MAG: hypothetical protein ACXAC7_20920, partial [Candidatus Hodarchaeales archaeon]